MGKLSIFFVIFFCYTSLLHSERQIIVFVNEAPESVLVYIGYDNRAPVRRSIVERGDRKYFFPPEMMAAMPYHVNLEGMFSQAQYTLRLTGDLQQGVVRACRAYGDLQLLRGDVLIGSIGAGGTDRGIVLTYTPDYELKLSHLEMKDRPHSTKKGCSPYCNTCMPRVRIEGSS